jgi:hypothetical protein
MQGLRRHVRFVPNPDTNDAVCAKKSRPKAALKLKTDDRRSSGHQLFPPKDKNIAFLARR